MAIIVTHLPVTECQLMTGLSGRLFADLVGQVERLDDGQNGRDAERSGTFFQIAVQDAAVAPS